MRRLWALWTLAVLTTCTSSCVPSGLRGARGTGRLPLVYVTGYRPKILGFQLHVDAGTLTPLGSTPAGRAPSFLTWGRSAKFLYAVDEVVAGRVLGFAIDPTTGALAPLTAAASAGIDPAHLSVDRTGRWLLVANYAGKQPGVIAVLPVGTDGRLGEPVATWDLGPGSKPHLVIADPTNRYVLVPCKGGPYVAQLRFDAQTGALSRNEPDRVTWPGARGPRHLAFHPSGLFAYVIDEQAMTMTALAFDGVTGRLSPLQTVSTLPVGVDPLPSYSAAEVVVHPTGRFVYGSNRGHDSIVIYRLDPAGGRLTLVGHQLGALWQPRHFSIDPTGTLLLAANERGDSVTVFRIDQSTGLLGPIGQPVPAGRRPTFVGVVPVGG